MQPECYFFQCYFCLLACSDDTTFAAFSTVISAAIVVCPSPENFGPTPHFALVVAFVTGGVQGYHAKKIFFYKFVITSVLFLAIRMPLDPTDGGSIRCWSWSVRS